MVCVVVIVGGWAGLKLPGVGAGLNKKVEDVEGVEGAGGGVDRGVGGTEGVGAASGSRTISGS